MIVRDQRRCGAQRTQLLDSKVPLAVEPPLPKCRTTIHARFSVRTIRRMLCRDRNNYLENEQGLTSDLRNAGPLAPLKARVNESEGKHGNEVSQAVRTLEGLRLGYGYGLAGSGR